MFKAFRSININQCRANVDLRMGQQTVSFTANKSVKRNLIEAHSWLGIIFSILLFLIFWAGSISLFKDEIQQWAEMPHYPIDQSIADKPLLEIIDAKLREFPLNTKEHLAIVLPSEQHPYYWFSIDLLTDESDEEHKEGAEHADEAVKEIKVNPKTGEVIGGFYQFSWADFIYRLHFDLNMQPYGIYFMGIVTLFFLFALFSGIYIHARKIIPQFFSYRIKKQRTQLLDLHNIIGVMSLPFTIMYAITGLMFNLVIVFQIAFVMIVYKGDQDTLFVDAGFPPFVAQQQTGASQDMSAILPILEQVEKELGTATMLIFHNYGDENAVLQIFGEQRDHFSQSYEIFFKVKDGTIIQQSDYEHLNVFRKGRDVLTTLHYGNYAGVDLRALYFALSMAIIGMILAGNMLWIQKRQTQANVSHRVTKFMGNLTVGSCCGFVLATAFGFFAERVLPPDLLNRSELLIIIFSGVTVIITLSAYWYKNNKQFIAKILYATVAVLLLTIVCDWLMFSETLIFLWQTGFKSIIGVQIGFVLFSICCLFIAKQLLRKKRV